MRNSTYIKSISYIYFNFILNGVVLETMTCYFTYENLTNRESMLSFLRRPNLSTTVINETYQFKISLQLKFYTYKSRNVAQKLRQIDMPRVKIICFFSKTSLSKATIAIKQIM